VVALQVVRDDAEPPLPHENTRGISDVGLEEDARRTIERVELDARRGPGKLLRVGVEIRCRACVGAAGNFTGLPSAVA